MTTVEKKAIFTTELNADCTEWCPIEEYSDLFVCGTYQLVENDNSASIGESKKRLGILYLFQFTDDKSGILKLLHQISMPGILDCKWCHTKLNGSVLLAVVNAVGELRLLKLLKNEKFYIEEIQKIKVTDSDTLLLSLDWSTGVCSNNVKLVVSSSKGNVATFLYKDGTFTEDNSWSLHDYEAWIVAFNYFNVDIFFSGGDDCKLQCFDVRMGRTVSSNRHHTAGVTSLQMSYKDENRLISGSYDERILFWDIRNMKVPSNSLELGGGVWRLKWEPKLCQEICASCMYNGSVVINALSNEVIAEYKVHENINYGIDWSYLPEEKICKNLNIKTSESFKHKVLTVCSFYDNLLSLALIQILK